MLMIPLKPVPNQSAQVVLGGQSCVVHVYQLAYGLFLDLTVNNIVPIAAGAICQDRNRIVRGAYLGFAGDLAFWDSQGTEDPVYTGIGSRFFLFYLGADEVAG